MKFKMSMRTRKLIVLPVRESEVGDSLLFTSLRFPKLTEEHFKSSPWPDADEVSPLVDDDQPFLILYKELYYRHIYARIQGGPTIEQRFESYYNYCQLFNHILSIIFSHLIISACNPH
jgi:hypothetical protein